MSELTEITKTLGRIEGKLVGICAKQDDQKKDIKDLKERVDKKFDGLPCHHQYEMCHAEIKTKMSTKLILPVLTALFIFASGAYIYTHKSNVEIRSVVEKKHEVTRKLIIDETQEVENALEKTAEIQSKGE